MATAKGKTNTFAIWVTIAVVVVVAIIAGLVIWMNASSAGPGTEPESEIVNTETGAIAIGDGDDTVATYVDFMCPVCGSFEDTYGETLADLAADDTITLEIHPIAILDRFSSGTQYSTRAANAMYAVAVADPDVALEYMQVLFANQPAENTEGLSNEELISLAESVGATEVAGAITDGTYEQYVGHITEQTPIQPGQTGISTPTVSINGETIANSELTGDPEADFVNRFAD